MAVLSNKTSRLPKGCFGFVKVLFVRALSWQDCVVMAGRYWVRFTGPNRSFGLLLGAVCAILSVFAYRAGRASDIVWAILAIGLVLTALIIPRVLAPARRGWLRIGHALGFVVNPIVLGVVYGAVFIPFGALMRLFRSDPMARRFDPAAKSYWIERQPGDAIADSLKEQF
jgi:Saxitoxin biosynthesis operon protein SxtJ